jgi:hypothetical protein
MLNDCIKMIWLQIHPCVCLCHGLTRILIWTTQGIADELCLMPALFLHIGVLKKMVHGIIG